MIKRILAAAVSAISVVLVVWWTTAVFSPTGVWPLSEQLAWRFTPRWAALASALLVAVTMCVVHMVAVGAKPPSKPTEANLPGDMAERAASISDFRRAGLKGMVMGSDGRASTSKVQVAIWSVAIVFGLLMLLLAGRTPNCPIPAGTAYAGSCPADVMDGTPFARLLGSDFRWEYLLLLGWPLSVALIRKNQVLGALERINKRMPAGTPEAGTPQAVDSGTAAATKAPPADPREVGLLAGLRQIVTDDAGHGALLDVQYFVFTLITVGYFLLQLITNPREGLPEIPATLLVLMGLSGSGYLSGGFIEPIGKPEPDSQPSTVTNASALRP
ncbi:hypothetical protein [Sphaerisporangium perillae]|uniref:hypothetical protein n=1 Tax=Sphaerisporangium perillae TaxID=2935860 RepID=UPI00200BFC4E|nr:hypothetical protein [Sphaerisporangium perillae]